MSHALAWQAPSRPLPSLSPPLPDSEPAALPTVDSTMLVHHTLMSEAQALLLAVQLQASDADGWTYEAVPVDPLNDSTLYRVLIKDDAGHVVGFL
jgi:hypothetical protein